METKRKKFISMAIFSSLIAVGFHIYLTYKYYSLKFGLDGSSACNISELFNCDIASTSKYADIFGVPMALLGAITHLIISILLINGLTEAKDLKRPFHYGVLLSLFSVGISIIMGTISILFLSAYCPFCIAAYALSILTLTFSILGLDGVKLSGLFPEIKFLFSENKVSLYTVISIPIIAWFINYSVNEKYAGDRMNLFIQESISLWNSKESISFDLTKGLIKGAPLEKSKFVIVEFADYLCPHCKHANAPLKNFLATTKNATLIFKPYPLDGKCNSGINQSGDGYRCHLAYASYCAEKEFKSGWAYHDFIMDQQESFYSVQNIDDINKKLCSFNQSNCEKLISCMSSEDTANWVKSNAAEGTNAKISGTPTIFVNGKKLEGGQSLMVLKALANSIGAN